jgi:hypothetical protein
VTAKPSQGKRIAFLTTDGVELCHGPVSSRDPDDLPAFRDRIVTAFAGAAS